MLADHIFEPAGPPVADDASSAVVAEALASLGSLRAQQWLGDGAGQIHLLASLRHQIDLALSDAVGLARDQDCSWEQIATLVGVIPETARRRYSKGPEGAAG